MNCDIKFSLTNSVSNVKCDFILMPLFTVTPLLAKVVQKSWKSWLVFTIYLNDHVLLIIDITMI